MNYIKIIWLGKRSHRQYLLIHNEDFIKFKLLFYELYKYNLDRNNKKT